VTKFVVQVELICRQHGAGAPSRELAEPPPTLRPIAVGFGSFEQHTTGFGCVASWCFLVSQHGHGRNWSASSGHAGARGAILAVWSLTRRQSDRCIVCTAMLYFCKLGVRLGLAVSYQTLFGT